MTDSLLTFERVSRQYPRQPRPAVDEVSLELEGEEILALIGASGSGKTTMLRLAAGLEKPDGGSVGLSGQWIAGDNCPGRDLPPEKRQLGLVFQEGALFPHLTAGANVGYGLNRKDPARIAECLDLVGLGGTERRYPHEFSGGERQRLSLARALAPSPRLLLLDEPFSHLDTALRRSLREEVGGLLRDLGQAALLVTHDPEDALVLAGRVAILESGKLIQTGTPEQIYREPASRYCAERFGPINEVTDPVSGEVRLIRPESMGLAAGEAKETQLGGRVISVHQQGLIQEIRVTPSKGTDQDAVWICHADTDSVLAVGDEVSLSCFGQPGEQVKS
ncbi:MAG: ABC transporter ATP-binding protein [Verrucomicrobiota bacterium]